MKAITGLFFTLFINSALLFSQALPTWMHIENNGDTMIVQKTGKQISGNDTLDVYARSFSSNSSVFSFYMKESGDSTYLYQDSTYYFLYTFNNVQIGDVWQHPFFLFNSFTVNCDSSIQLVVTDIDSINLSGEWLKTIFLHRPSVGNYGFVIEKIGYSGYGGFFFNLARPFYENYTCVADSVIVDFWNYPTFCFQNYTDSVHFYGTNTRCNLGMDEHTVGNFDPIIKRKDDYIEVAWNDAPLQLKLYTVSGQLVVSSNNNTLYLPAQQGIYFLRIEQGQKICTTKIAN